MRNAALAYHRANIWLAENPAAWEQLCKLAQAEVRAQRRFGVQALVERVRWLDLVDVHGKPCRISNSIVAFLARKLIQELPEARPLIEMRPSAFDKFFLPGRRH